MKHKIMICPEGNNIYVEDGALLLDCLVEYGYFISATCGRTGICGKCRVKLINGTVKNVLPDENGYILSCKARVKSDLEIIVSSTNSLKKEEIAREKTENEGGFGVALDIGTTTLEACLVSLQTGRVVRKVSFLNPQAVFGADVLSRIRACQEGNLHALQSLVLNKTKELLDELAHGETIKELVVAANTTMLHLFLGVNPESIGVAPFTPIFTQTQYVTGKKLGLAVEKVRLLPSVSGYIGSDITAGLLSCEIGNVEKDALFIDIGTNGEIALCSQGKLYATSTAAGPALEGACIECGLGGVDGAIDKVYYQDGNLQFTTIGMVAPKGICGSGLVDLIALFLSEGLIDEGGAWVEDSENPLLSRLNDDKFYVTERIYVSQKDIRQFQLAKAAIMAGVETLLHEQQMRVEDVQALYIAGGLGYYLDAKNAGLVGLLPVKLLSKIQLVGNTSLQGATLCLLKQEHQKRIEDIATNTSVVELSTSPYFMDAYIDNISFIGE